MSKLAGLLYHKKTGKASVFEGFFRKEKDPPVPQNEKVLTRSRRWVRRCGASDFPLKKQTLPIAADHFTGAPVVQLWIKIIRTPNTADLK